MSSAQRHCRVCVIVGPRVLLLLTYGPYYWGIWSVTSVKLVTVKFICKFQVPVLQITFLTTTMKKDTQESLCLHISRTHLIKDCCRDPEIWGMLQFSSHPSSALCCSSASSLTATEYIMLLRFLIYKNPVGVKSCYLVGHAVDPLKSTHHSRRLS
jgi:hypothetical protein